MPVIINGTTGISGVDGSAATPAIEGGDANTGMFFPAADTIAFAEGGVEALRINSSAQVEFQAGTSSLPTITASGDLNTGIFFPAADTIGFATSGAEEFRIGPAGQFGIAGANYGTSGQVLTSGGASASPSWTAPSSGIWTYIGTSTASTSSAIVFTNLGSYEMLRLSYFNARPTTDDSTLRITLSSDNGSTYIITGYDGLAQQGNARFLLTNSAAPQGNLNADGVAAGTVILGNFNIATKTTLTVSAVYGGTAGAINNWDSYAWQTSLTAMNAIRIFYSASGVEGTIATGTFVLEGLIQ